MSDIPTNHANQVNGPGQYEIRVKGHLELRWAAWFDGMTLTRQDDGTTVIHGPVADQSALHGLLRKLNDIGLPLVSVTPRQSTSLRPTAPPTPADRPASTDQHPRRSTT
jgi:hypothetical protein